MDYLPAFNGRGDVCQLINASDGSLAARYEYDPFGKLTALGGAYADANPFRFSTKIADAVTGYSYFGYRDYHPHLGRWLNRDPIAEAGGLNLHAYVGNAVADVIDWLGLCPGRKGRAAGVMVGPRGEPGAGAAMFGTMMTMNEAEADTVSDWRPELSDAAFADLVIRGSGLLQAIGGAAEAAAAVLVGASTGGVGALVAAPVGAMGLDNVQAGLWTLFTGTPTPTILNGGLRDAGMGEAADMGEFGLNLVGGGLLLGVQKLAREGAERLGKELGQEAGEKLGREAAENAADTPCCPDEVIGAGRRGTGKGGGKESPRLVDFDGDQPQMLENALQDLADAGYDTSLIEEVIRADLPNGTHGLTAGSDAIALSDSAFSSSEFLNHVLEEELIHLMQKAAGMADSFGPGTARQLEEAADAIRKFPRP